MRHFRLLLILAVSVGGLSIGQSGRAMEPREEDIIDSDKHEGHAGEEGKGNRYLLKSRTPVGLLGATLHYQIFAKQGMGSSGDIFASLDKSKSWVRIAAWSPTALRVGQRRKNWHSLSLSPFVTRMKVKETDSLSIEFRWKDGKDALGIRNVAWAKRGAGRKRSPETLGDAAICVLPLDEIETEGVGAGAILTTKDATKNEIDGRILGAVSVEGVVGRGFRFDGNDAIVMGKLWDHVTRDLDAVSVSLWIKPSEKSGMAFDVGFYGDSITVWSGPGASFVISKNAGGTTLKFSEPKIGEWYHLVTVWDGQAQSVHVDGKLISKTPTPKPGTLNRTSIGHRPGRLGSQAKEASRGGRYFRGELDEFAIFAKALDEDEVQLLFGLPETKESVASLVK